MERAVGQESGTGRNEGLGRLRRLLAHGSHRCRRGKQSHYHRKMTPSARSQVGTPQGHPGRFLFGDLAVGPQSLAVEVAMARVSRRYRVGGGRLRGDIRE